MVRGRKRVCFERNEGFCDYCGNSLNNVRNRVSGLVVCSGCYQVYHFCGRFFRKNIRPGNPLLVKEIHNIKCNERYVYRYHSDNSFRIKMIALAVVRNKRRAVFKRKLMAKQRIMSVDELWDSLGISFE